MRRPLDPETGLPAICKIVEIDIFEDVTEYFLSDYTKAIRIAQTLQETDDECVAIRVEMICEMCCRGIFPHTHAGE